MTPPDDFSDRDAILARRALFLSTALAALHCGSPKDQSSRPTATEVTVIGSSAPSGSPTSSATARTSDAPPLASFADVLRLAPPRRAPAQVTGNEKVQADALEQMLDQKYGALRAAWESVPGCDPADPGCRPSWRATGDKLRSLMDVTRAPRIGGCGGASGRTGTLVARQQAHDRYVAAQVEKLVTHLTAVAASFSPQGEQEWRKLLANAQEPPPMPCLSPCPMPEVQELSQWIPFDKDGSTLRDDPTTKAMLEGVVASFKRNTKPSTIEVRGHADATETKPDVLARARATAVARWLEKAGVPRAQIRERSFAAEFPVGRSDDDAGASENRRVDFEAVPR